MQTLLFIQWGFYTEGILNFFNSTLYNKVKVKSNTKPLMHCVTRHYCIVTWASREQPNTRGEVNKFVALGIFLYNSKFSFIFLYNIKLCWLNDNSHSVNTYIFALTFLAVKPIPIGKNEVRILSSEHKPRVAQAAIRECKFEQ